MHNNDFVFNHKDHSNFTSIYDFTAVFYLPSLPSISVTILRPIRYSTYYHYSSISPSNVFLLPILFKFVIFRTYQFQNRNCRVVDQSSGMIKGSVPPSFVTRCVTMGRLLVSVSTVPSRTCTAS